MVKIYLYEESEGVPKSFLVSLFKSNDIEFGPLFQKVKVGPFKHMVQFVVDVKEADYMMLAHNFFGLSKTYLKSAEKFALSNNLKTIIVSYGDSHEKVSFNNSVILRPAKYKSTLQKNEIIIPAFVEDLGSKYGVEYLNKDKVPVVGFAGMTHLPTIIAECKYQLKIILNVLMETLSLKREYERTGLYFRRKTLNVLSISSSCSLVSHKRKSYSAARKTVQGDIGNVRKEFVDSIKTSHLPLVVRGNGNYSLRFFEILSLGRIPLFIDTDTPLPLEDEIDYDAFMLRVSYEDIDKLDEIIADFWSSISEEEFITMQKKARSIFDEYLKVNVFHKNFFDNPKKFIKNN